MDNIRKLEELKKRKETLTSKLKGKRLSLGEADGAMFSRFPSGRVELEDDIQVLERVLESIQSEIERLEKL